MPLILRSSNIQAAILKNDSFWCLLYIMPIYCLLCILSSKLSTYCYNQQQNYIELLHTLPHLTLIKNQKRVNYLFKGFWALEVRPTQLETQFKILNSHIWVAMGSTNMEIWRANCTTWNYFISLSKDKILYFKKG